MTRSQLRSIDFIHNYAQSLVAHEDEAPDVAMQKALIEQEINIDLYFQEQQEMLEEHLADDPAFCFGDIELPF